MAKQTYYCPVDVQDKTLEEIRRCRYLRDSADCGKAHTVRDDGRTNCLPLEKHAQSLPSGRDPRLDSLPFIPEEIPDREEAARAVLLDE